MTRARVYSAASAALLTTYRPGTLMDLLIVRHAIAFDRNPRRWRDDGERPLSPEGMVRARKAAAGLKQITDRPQCVLCSPLVRARQTATILAEFSGWPKPVECPA